MDAGDPSTQPAIDRSSEPALPSKLPLRDAPPPYYPPIGQAVLIRNGQIQPDDYMGYSIWLTVCCCLLLQLCVLPCGIIGIIKASEVRSRFRVGDYKGAEDASRAAKKWTTIGMVAGIIQLIVFFTLYLVIYLNFMPV